MKIFFLGLLLLGGVLSCNVVADLSVFANYAPNTLLSGSGDLSGSELSMDFVHESGYGLGSDIVLPLVLNPPDPSGFNDVFYNDLLYFQVGFVYNAPQNVYSASQVLGGVENSSILSLGAGPKLNLHYVFSNFMLHVDHGRFFYAGANYTYGSWTQGATDNPNFELNGNIGYQIGYSYRMSRWLVADIGYYWLKMKGGQISTITFDDLEDVSLILRLKWVLL